MKKFKVIFDWEGIMSISGDGDTMVGFGQEIEADRFTITNSGELVFKDEDGSDCGAVSHGVWKMVKQL